MAIAIPTPFDREPRDWWRPDRTAMAARRVTADDLLRINQRTSDLPFDNWGADHFRDVVYGDRGNLMFSWAACRRVCRPQRRWGVWVRAIRANGVVIAQLRCVVCCGAMKEIGAKKIANGQILPLYADNRGFAGECHHCGSSEGTEVHHWAPRHLFDDADYWPTCPLCPTCHRLWHRTVTPGMRRREPRLDVPCDAERWQHWRDYTDTGECERCGTRKDVAPHRWGPVDLFPDDADDWPTSDLCSNCRQVWHDTIAPVRACA